MDRITKTDEEWEKELPSEVFEVTRKKGTEAPFSGKFYKHNENGNYVCSNCGLELFSSKSKFDSGSGWPSFDEVINQGNIELLEDKSHGMNRTEVVCKRCNAHLGHLFFDGLKETTGKRYCINSVSLDFNKK